MKSLALALALALAVGLVAVSLEARAQDTPPGGAMAGADPAAPGAQMPDVRQMSGKARPDESVPRGVLTVKVVRGELFTAAPKGTPVQLAGVAADGSATVRTAPTGEDGHAVFTELVSDGSVVYYALCAFGGDRLSSEPVTLPPKVGVKLVLAGRKVGPDGKPVGDAIDDERNGEGGAPPPAGQVDVSVRGPAEVTAAVLRELGKDGARRAAPLDAKAQTARWTGVPAGDGKVYVVELTAAGRTFVSAPFLMGPDAGARRMILAYEKLLLALQGGVQVDDESLGFEVQLALANLTGMPFDPGPDGVLIPLPRGFSGAQIQGDESGARVAIEPHEGVRVRGIIPPGQREVVVQFNLALDDGRVAVEMPAPFGVFSSQLFVSRVPGMVITPGTGVPTAPKPQRSEDGREYLVLSDLQVQPGGTLRFDVAGLPVPARWQGIARSLVGLLVATIIIVAVAFAVRRPRVVARPATREGERQGLIAQRERLYAELVSLERARALRKIEDDQFVAQRRGIMTRLVLVHRQLDDLDAPGAGARPAAGSS